MTLRQYAIPTISGHSALCPCRICANPDLLEPYKKALLAAREIESLAIGSGDIHNSKRATDLRDAIERLVMTGRSKPAQTHYYQIPKMDSPL